MGCQRKRSLPCQLFARTAILVVGSKQMKVNEQTLTLHTAPRQYQSAILVPLEALEALGLVTAWNPAKTAVDLKPEFTVVKKSTFSPFRLQVSVTAANMRKSPRSLPCLTARSRMSSMVKA
ncbi:stalk domain-containing protein [Paenibacillus rhizoplanae]